MPRFFFNIRDGGHLPDREGVELPGLAEARQEAVRLMGALLQDRPEDFWASGSLAVLVDCADKPSFALTTTASDDPQVAPETRREDEERN